MNQPAQRLSGVLTGIWVNNDHVDILVHGVLTTKNSAGQTIHYDLTLAVDPDTAPLVADLITAEVAELDATPSAIDDHDQVVDEGLDLGGAA